jgi:hypothetical protein
MTSGEIYFVDFALLRQESLRLRHLQKRPGFISRLDFIKQIEVAFLGFPHILKSESVNFAIMCEAAHAYKRYAVLMDKGNFGDLYITNFETLKNIEIYYNRLANSCRILATPTIPSNTPLITLESVEVPDILPPVYYFKGTSALKNLGRMVKEFNYNQKSLLHATY